MRRFHPRALSFLYCPSPIDLKPPLITIAFVNSGAGLYHGDQELLLWTHIDALIARRYYPMTPAHSHSQLCHLT